MAPATTHLRTVSNEDGAAVLDLRQGTVFTLNATAGYVWEALGRGEATEQIVAGLAERTGEPSHLIERDVREFLLVLEEHTLVPRGERS